MLDISLSSSITFFLNADFPKPLDTSLLENLLAVSPILCVCSINSCHEPVIVQMVGLYTDPKGEDIFKNTSVASSSFGVTKETEYKFTESEVLGLRKRVKELETRVEVC